MIEPGDPAPNFSLPGIRGSDAGLFALDCGVRRGAVLLVFVEREHLDGSAIHRGPVDAATWLQFDGVRVWIVTSGPPTRLADRSPSPGVTILLDVEAKATTRYEGRGDAETRPSFPTLVLVDQSRTVRFARQIDEPSEPESIGELRRVIEHVRTPQKQETPA